MVPRVVYLGNLIRVVRVLQKQTSLELAGWILEAPDLNIPEVAQEASLFSRPLIPVKNKKDLLSALGKLGNLDLGILANFGIILERTHLEIPRAGFINLHLGLLPDYPGRSPIQDALKNKEKVIGVTLHRVTEEIDRGPILATHTVATPTHFIYEQAFQRLEDAAEQILEKNLPTLLQK